MRRVVAAAVGLLLAQLTHDPFYDGAASVLIGIILALTAALLAYESKGLLIGEAANPELVQNPNVAPSMGAHHTGEETGVPSRLYVVSETYFSLVGSTAAP